MAEEELVGLLTLNLGEPRAYTSEAWPSLSAFSWEVSRPAADLGYWLQVRVATPDTDEFAKLSHIDQEVIKLFWNRLSPIAKNEERVYFALLSNPLDDTAGDGLVAELNPLGLRPIDDTKPGARNPLKEIRAFRVLRQLWFRPEVTEGIFAAFTYETSWLHLEERNCSFDEMLADLYHWFDADGGWVDKVYRVRK